MNVNHSCSWRYIQKQSESDNKKNRVPEHEPKPCKRICPPPTNTNSNCSNYSSLLAWTALAIMRRDNHFKPPPPPPPPPSPPPRPFLHPPAVSPPPPCHFYTPNQRPCAMARTVPTSELRSLKLCVMAGGFGRSGQEATPWGLHWRLLCGLLQHGGVKGGVDAIQLCIVEE